MKCCYPYFPNIYVSQIIIRVRDHENISVVFLSARPARYSIVEAQYTKGVLSDLTEAVTQ